MNEVAPDILPNPEQSELKTLSLVSIDDMADVETPVTSEKIEPKAELNDVADDDIPVTPERIEPKSASKKSNSIGDTSTSNQRVEVRARYLDTSSGSCHDFCKYGHKNIKESTSSFIAKQKKKLAANSKTLSEPNGEKFNQPRVAEKKIDSVTKTSLSPANSMIRRASSISTTSDKSDKKLKVKKNSLSPANSTVRRASSISTTSDKSDKKLNDVIQVNPMGSSLSKGKKKELGPPNAPLLVKPSIKRELKGKSENVKDLKEVSSLRKHGISVGKVEKKQSLDEKTFEKKLGGHGNEMQNDEQMCLENKKGKQKSPGSVTTRSSLISRNKNLGLKRDQTTLSKSIKIVDRISSSEGSGTKTKKQMPKEKVDRISSSWPKRVGKKVGLEEKIDSAHKLSFKRGKVLDVKLNNTAPKRLKFKLRKVLPEDLNSNVDDVASSKTKPVRQITNPKIGINTRLKRVGKVGLGGEEKSDKSAHKLNFEGRKVVDLQPKYTAPRRLKFKPRKVIVENANGDSSRRNLKNFFGVDEVKGTNSEHLRVVLKHQDIEGKKDVQSLLNNVIEETATRLVRLRKSKVKALVGAFESLMSLPDAKSSTTSAS